jgi:dimethylargininase
VVTVPVGAATLHLKSPLSALDAATLLVGGSPAARALGHRTSEALRSHRRSLRMEVLQDDLAANVLAIGDGVVMQGGMPQSQERLQALCKQRRLHLHVVDQLTEFAKTDGALTCLSILAR